MCMNTNIQVIIKLTEYRTMMFMKIGKQKHKYKLNISIHKAQYDDAANYTDGQILKIKVIRGNHELEFKSQPIKKGSIKFSKAEKEPKTIPMTLFYDASDKKYLQKDLQIKAYIFSNGEQIRKIGVTKLDVIADIMEVGTGKFALEIDIDEEQEQYGSCKLTFHLELVRVSDDSQSVQTSQYNSVSNDVKPTQIQKKPNPKITIPKDLPKPPKQTPKMPKDIPKIENTPKVIQQPTKVQPVATEFSFQKVDQPSNQSNNSKKPLKQPPKQMNSNPQSQNKDLNEYIYKRKYQESQKQYDKILKENKSMKGVIQNLLQEKRKQEQLIISQKNQKDAFQGYKSQLIQKQLKIHELEAINSSSKEREQQNEKTIERQKRQIAMYKQMVEKQKNKMALIMQKCLQTGDDDLVSFLQKYLTKQQDDI